MNQMQLLLTSTYLHVWLIPLTSTQTPLGVKSGSFGYDCKERGGITCQERGQLSTFEE